MTYPFHHPVVTFVGEGLVLVGVVLHVEVLLPQIAEVSVHLCTEDMSFEGCHTAGARELTAWSCSFLFFVLLS